MTRHLKCYLCSVAKRHFKTVRELELHMNSKHMNSELKKEYLLAAAAYLRDIKVLPQNKILTVFQYLARIRQKDERVP